jgi:hypothetical protein
MLAVQRFHQAGRDQRLDMLVQGATRAQPQPRAEFIQGRRRLALALAPAELVEDLLLSSRQGHVDVSCSFSKSMLR